MPSSQSNLPFYPPVSYSLPDSGGLTAIAVASDGTLVLVTQVFASGGVDPSVVFQCIVGRCGNGTIQWDYDEPATFFQLDGGAASGIDVSIDDNERVVFVFAQGSDLWYVTGTLGIDRYITWNDGVQFDSGDTPSVAISNGGSVLEAHRSQNDNSQVFYHFGSWNGAVIDWTHEHGRSLVGIQIGALDSVSSALNTSGMAVVGYSGGVDTGSGCYAIDGVVEGTTIKWAYLQSQMYAGGDGAQLHIDENGRVLATYQPFSLTINYDIRYRTGLVTDEGKKVDFDDEAKYDAVASVVKSAMSPGGNYVVLLYQDDTGTYLAYADVM